MSEDSNDEQGPVAKKQKRATESADDNQFDDTNEEKEEKEEMEYERSDGYFDPEGNLEILSSDEVLFLIPAYLVQAGSEVWRDMVKNATNSRIELCDEELETAHILESLFDIITRRVYTRDISKRTIVRVIRLARKYEFVVVNELISFETKCDLHDQRASLRRSLVIAAILDDMDLIVTGLVTGLNNRVFQPDTSETFGLVLPAARVNDPGWH